ncbi:MAG: hypothetical protein ACK5NT_10545 [Pyrinomonadaceae bacterium]
MWRNLTQGFETSNGFDGANTSSSPQNNQMPTETKLVVNPYATVSFIDDICIVTAPLPGKGLQLFEIESKSKPELFELFKDLSTLRLDFLDIDEDLDADEIDLLRDIGFLVAPKHLPQKPLFECGLDDLDAGEVTFKANSLVLNPNAKFEPMTVDTAGSFIREKNLMPFKPVIWVKTPVTEIDLGYWIDEEKLKVIEGLFLGKSEIKSLPNELIKKLVLADILIDPKLFREKTDDVEKRVKEAQNHFSINKYASVERLIPRHQMHAMQKYYRQYVANGFMPFGDGQVVRRYYQHNEPLARSIHGNLTKVMELIVGKPVKPAYVYAASYIEDSYLEPHIDRLQCEYSFSFQVDYIPELAGQKSTWGLFVADPKNFLREDLSEEDGRLYSNEFPADNQENDSNRAVYLSNGDALAYMGCDLIHYRYPLPKGHNSTSMFFHYVPEDFEGVLH